MISGWSRLTDPAGRRPDARSSRARSCSTWRSSQRSMSRLSCRRTDPARHVAASERLPRHLSSRSVAASAGPSRRSRVDHDDRRRCRAVGWSPSGTSCAV